MDKYILLVYAIACTCVSTICVFVLFRLLCTQKTPLDPIFSDIDSDEEYIAWKDIE
jgi:hypothetical protein